MIKAANFTPTNIAFVISSAPVFVRKIQIAFLSFLEAGSAKLMRRISVLAVWLNDKSKDPSSYFGKGVAFSLLFPVHDFSYFLFKFRYSLLRRKALLLGIDDIFVGDDELAMNLIDCSNQCRRIFKLMGGCKHLFKYLYALYRCRKFRDHF